MSEELLPCPFCGCRGVLRNSPLDGQEYAQVVCRQFYCPANNAGNPPQSESDAMHRWNTRHRESGQIATQQPASVAVPRELLERAIDKFKWHCGYSERALIAQLRALLREGE